MRKIGEEIRFQQIREFIDRELDVAGKRPDTDKFDLLEGRLDNLDKSYAKIEESLMGDRRLNRSDVRTKLDNYKQECSQLRRRFEEIELAYQKQLLFKKPSNEVNGQGNMKGLEELHEINRFIVKEFVETAGIVQNTKEAVHGQRERIEALGEEWEEADAELTMTDQFMRTISNRNLLTKLILVLLAVFLGLADIAILVLKIM